MEKPPIYALRGGPLAASYSERRPHVGLEKDKNMSRVCSQPIAGKGVVKGVS